VSFCTDVNLPANSSAEVALDSAEDVLVEVEGAPVMEYPIPPTPKGCEVLVEVGEAIPSTSKHWGSRRRPKKSMTVIEKAKVDVLKIQEKSAKDDSKAKQEVYELQKKFLKKSLSNSVSCISSKWSREENYLKKSWSIKDAYIK